MIDRIFLDTNVLVYAFDASEPRKQERAWSILENAVTGTRFVISTQVLQEFYVTVSRKLLPPLPEEEAERAVQDLGELPVTPVDVPMVLSAIRTCRKHQVSLWDALIVEAANASGCQRLYTEDMQDGQTFGTVTIENPFKH